MSVRDRIAPRDDLVRNLKRYKFTGGWAAVDSNVTNVGRQAFIHLVQKCCQFLGVAFGHKFHPAVGEVPHETGDRKSPGDLAGGVPKTDPLYAARVKHMAALVGGSSHASLSTDCPSAFEEVDQTIHCNVDSLGFQAS